jgi:transposase
VEPRGVQVCDLRCRGLPPRRQSRIRRRPVMSEGITFVGIDASKKTNHVALLLPREKSPVEFQVGNDAKGIRRLARRLKKDATGDVRACYEAGPCGYALQRQLRAAGIECIVVAPSLIPVKPGDHIKTDRRDAKKLAEFLRADMLTEVHPPTEAEEAVRNLCRCREAARQDLTRARHRLSKLLLRQGCVYHGNGWTQQHRAWLKSLSFAHEADQVVFDDYFRSLEHLEERLRGLAAKLEELSQKDPYREPVGWLRCFRGIDTVIAMMIVAELHDFRRFHSARELMSYLGLVPSEDSSGERTQRGSITKAGNKHVRRVLVEAAWSYQHKPGVGAGLRRRREAQPGWVLATADRAQQRLHRRYWKLVLGGKAHNKAVTAVARELVGFIWGVLYEGERAAVDGPVAAGRRGKQSASGRGA